MEEHRLSVFRNRMMRRIFVPYRKEVTGGWKRVHSEELNDFLPLTVRMIRLRWMRWTFHVACTGEKRNICKVLVGDLVAGEKIVCDKMHLKERGWEVEYSSTSEQGQVVSSCEHGNELVGSLKCGES
jgi:hypothetical protein